MGTCLKRESYGTFSFLSQLDEQQIQSCKSVIVNYLSTLISLPLHCKKWNQNGLTYTSGCLALH